MSGQAPTVDGRTYESLVVETSDLVKQETGWAPAAPDAGYALIRVFARMVSQVVERLNQVPDRNFLAFLNLISAEPEPPEPARAPLTFSLAAGATSDATAPVRTAVAAKPEAGDQGEVVFETEAELVITPARLVAVLSRRTDVDRFDDRTSGPPGGYAPFAADTLVEHALYIDGGDVFAVPQGTTVTIDFGLSLAQPSLFLDVDWSYWDGAAWHPVVTIDFFLFAPGVRRQVVQFAPLPSILSRELDGRTGLFVRARPKGPLIDASTIADVHGVTVTAASVTRTGRLPDAAFAGSAPVDTTLGFHPFGEQPKLGDVLYLGQAEILGRPGATVTADFTRSEETLAPSAQDAPTVVWEVWSDGAWLEIGRSQKDQSSLAPDGTPYTPNNPSPFGFADGTMALTWWDPVTLAVKAPVGGFVKGNLSFKLPAGVAPITVRGAASAFLRGRLVKGGYGKGVTLQVVGGVVKGLLDDGYRPPIVSSVVLGHVYTDTRSPAALLMYNDGAWADHTGDAPGAAFAPFTRAADTEPALYLGFDRPFSNRAQTLFVDVALPASYEVSADALGALPPLPAQIAWEYASPSGWSSLGAEDGTSSLAESGLVRFIGPADLVTRSEFGLDLQWLRLRLVQGAFVVTPRIRAVLTNTVWAEQTETITLEVLGSSTGQPDQAFTTARAPVLPGQALEVFERVVPPDAEAREVTRLEGADAVSISRDEHGHVLGAWVRWHAVPDFYRSGARDRHYTIDRVSGRVTFGDGPHGLPPPLGANNIRIASYRTGGGAQGNRPRGAITVLKSAVPYVDQVTNTVASSGGADAESIERTRDRGPRLVRHAGRAIAGEDYEDLARDASPAVARARAFGPHFDPLDLADPFVPGPPPIDAGHVLLIIVPDSGDARPVPGVGLIDDVRSYLSARCPPAVTLTVAGPDWIWVSATVTLVPASLDGADALRGAVSAAIKAFLHPLTGGSDGAGWAFGRLPHASDLHAILAGIEGIDHVREITLLYRRPPPGPEPPGDPAIAWLPVPEDSMGPALERALVFSGEHTVLLHAPEGG